MAPPLSILAVILHVVSATAVKALVFDVPSGSSKCLTEELHRRAVSHASYRVVAESTSAADRRILVRVTGPRGEELYVAEGGERGEFRFEAAEDGEHTACFWSPRYERGTVVSVDVQWATTSVGGGAHAGGSGSPPAVAVASEGRIATIIGELKKLEDSARLIHQEMLSFRQRWSSFP
ncbi:hypothetical protein BDA96_01G409900 [Sorghum bicolor]|uniref:GOLD domain-containing protein n=2 Tax=Sorghum bicolor TaxID=4558 RepID=A0A1B6QNH7_SORBI|nr:transmembrane emp24 domain-containing protein p24delta7 isoform X2 [Sorghum bicolor]KAG0551282.1 hypothetical protein BDA96_01G409900 [Sorghum bicolor]KXG39464.1 hypothetical protein SORBI_3001G385200 [Sorghum bicolor]OQU92663.1 hypothetical protein SORBI_3001G385200 [Sorghum bicolor]|eukprot:XP_021306177.1 transmembrane emp24 domain-containing protein p24delta7 isoform X2 [Sorghum bicolor]